MWIFHKKKCGACGKTKYFTNQRTIIPKKVAPQGLLTPLTSQEPLCRKCFKVAKTRL